MDTKWFVTANKEAARIFVRTAEFPGLKKIKSLTNPLAGEKRSSLLRHKAGASGQSTGRGGTRMNMRKAKTDPLEAVAEQFASKIAKLLRAEQLKGNFGALTIAAEPKFLGKVKASLEKETASTVSEWIRKDLAHVPLNELGEFLGIDAPKRPKVRQRKS